MGEPTFRFAELVVPPVVAMNGTRSTFEGLENLPARDDASRANPKWNALWGRLGCEGAMVPVTAQ